MFFLIKNLSFSYDKENTIGNFSYIFLKDKIYLIKGENGKDKSTLINLIIGLYIDKICDEIRYNDINIKEIDMVGLRKNLVSVVEQKPVIIEREKLLEIGEEKLKNLS